MDWTTSSTNGPIVCGHRGAAAIEAENTLPSFQSALDRGATWVEFDVRPTGDGALVLHHDPETASGQHIATTPRASLDPSIPVLGELVAALPILGLDLEMKTDGIEMTTSAFVDLVVSEIDEHVRNTDALLVTSFDVSALAAFHRKRPSLATGLLFHDRPFDWAIQTAADNGHVAIAPWHPLVTDELVERAHAARLGVATWTVNDAETVAKAVASGVDMIIGDDPAVIAANL